MVRICRIWWVVVIWGAIVWPCMAMPPLDQGELARTRAVAALEEGRLEEALSLLEQSLQEAPDSPEALLLMGLVLNRLQRYSEAVEHLQRVRGIRPDMLGLMQELGLSLYRLGRYGEALEALEEAIKRQRPRAQVLYLYGLVLNRLDRPEEARSAFEQAAEKDPSIRSVCLYRAGAISYTLRDFSAARNYFQRVIEAAEDPALVSSARRFLDRMAREEGTKRYYVSLSLGLQYDDNVILKPDDVQTETRVGDEGDVRFVLNGYGDYKFILTPTWELGAAISLYSSHHTDLHEFDLLGPKGIVYGGYRWGPLRTRLQYRYAYYWLDKNSYLRQHGAGPEIWWTQAPWAKLHVGYLYTKNDYFDLPGRDSFNHRAGFAQYFFWKQDAMLRLSYYADSEHATGNDFDYIGHDFAVFGSVKLPWRMLVQGGFDYYVRDYLHRHSVFRETRNDRRLTIGLEITRRITDFLDLSFGYTRVNNGSNIDFFEYVRNILALQLKATF